VGVSRVTTWAANDFLTAAALNGEFNNILNNGTDVGWPLTKNVSAGNFNIADLGILTIASGGKLVMTSTTQFWSKGTDIASAAALTMGSTGNYFDVTGTTTITSIGTQQAGTLLMLQFDSALTLTNSATLILPGHTNITTVTGDVAIFISEGGGTWRCISYQSATVAAGSGGTVDPKFISGMTYANSAGDVTNDIDIATGSAMDSTGAYLITVAALTKRLDAAWAVGTNQGGLDTGSIDNVNYYIWAIARSDTGVTDYLFSASATSPTMPTNYTYKRLIGFFTRAAGTILLFQTYETAGGGLELMYNSTQAVVTLAATLTTSRRTDSLVYVPLHFSVIAHVWVWINDASAASYNLVYCPDQADQVPSSSAFPFWNVSSATGLAGGTNLDIRTSSTGTIAARSTLATVDNYNVNLVGFTWDRRN
jgi:hypothetical protein